MQLRDQTQSAARLLEDRGVAKNGPGRFEVMNLDPQRRVHPSGADPDRTAGVSDGVGDELGDEQ